MKVDHYSRQEILLKKMREIALKDPDSIWIVETNVEAEMQIEFYERLQVASVSKGLCDIEILSEILYSDFLSLKDKKSVIIQLVAWEDIKAYRVLEDYLKNPDVELKNWAYLAYHQARLFLESNLLEESKIFVASGLGGKDHRLRFMLAFSAFGYEFTSLQKDVVNTEIHYLLKKNDAIVEDITFLNNYVITTALIPLYLNFDELMHQVILEINQYGNFLKQNMFITNEKRVSIDDLDVIFKKINKKTNF